jgi:hypothetical protein
MTVPEHIRSSVRDRLWAEADRLNWPAMLALEKSRYYSIWTETPTIGGALAAYMDARKVRVYIKDTLLKAYTRERLQDHTQVFRVLNLPAGLACSHVYIKPHGRRLADGRHIAWSRATEWKATLMTIYERAFEKSENAYAVVLFEAGTKHADPNSRLVVEEASRRLRIERLTWLD